MSTTIVIPISREEHLEKLFRSLELLECDANKTSLFTYVDGDSSLFLKARNLTEQSKFSRRLCIQRPRDQAIQRFNILVRRRRIAAIHNEIRSHLQPCDYIFLVEDDTLIPPMALKKLLFTYSVYPYAGFVSGVELGRWGITHVGAWKADDAYEPTRLESLEVPADSLTIPVVEVDAAGMYCVLTKYENYAKHEFKPFDGNNLGPDVDWGISLRQQGFKNYVDWSVKCAHLLKSGESLTIGNTDVVQVAMVKKDNGTWRQEIF